MSKLRDILLDLRHAAADVVRGAPQGLGRGAGKRFAPFESGGVTVQCHSQWPTDVGLIAEWDELSRCAPGGTALHSPAWQAAAFSGSGAKKLRLITVQGEKLLAVIPMQLSPAGGLGTIAPWMVDYLDPLMAADAGRRVWPAVLGFIASQWDRRVTEVVLHNVRAAAAVRGELPAIAPECGFSVEEAVVDHAPSIELRPTWEGYLASLDAHERKETRRKVKKAEEKGAGKLVRGDSGALVEALRLMELAEGAKGKTVRRYLRPLLMTAGPALMAAGRLEVLTLEIEGKAAGCLIQFPTPAGPMLYNSGLDPAMKEWSPGVVAVAMAIREAIGRGEKRYDLLRGREPYKYRLGATDQALYRLTLRKR